MDFPFSIFTGENLNISFVAVLYLSFCHHSITCIKCRLPLVFPILIGEDTNKLIIFICGREKSDF